MEIEATLEKVGVRRLRRLSVSSANDEIRLAGSTLGRSRHVCAFFNSREVEWAVEDRPLLNDVLEYETRLNYALPKYDDVVLCMYDLAKFDAGVAMDILRTHPMVIIRGVLQENVFFVPPDEFLRELRDRAGKALPS
ncbi:MAG: sensory transduction histidine kinase [Chthonomonadaceae bacterium]|nr:sensory transduction histidine kinase [Chthonomonadaceae bacterium]